MKSKIKKILKKSFILRVILIKKRIKQEKLLSKMSDDELVEREIQKFTDYYKVPPNLNDPTTFSEKTLWQKLNYKNPELSFYADKYMVKNKIKEVLGVDLGVKTLKVFNTPNELNFDGLPNKFVLKINNGSGYIYLGMKKNNKYIFKDLKNTTSPLFSLKQIKIIFKLLFQLNLFYYSYEYAYKDIKPLLFIEEYLEENNLTDYKFHMNYGKFIFLNVVSGRQHDTKDDYYDENLNRMDIRWSNPPSENPTPLPKEVEQMKRYASILSKDFPISRIDFYIADNRIFLGEVTFYQEAGYFNIEFPSDLDLILGKKFDISRNFKNQQI